MFLLPDPCRDRPQRPRARTTRKRDLRGFPSQRSRLRLLQSQLAMIASRFFADERTAQQTLDAPNGIEPKAQTIFELYTTRAAVEKSLSRPEAGLADVTRAEFGPVAQCRCSSRNPGW